MSLEKMRKVKKIKEKSSKICKVIHRKRFTIEYKDGKLKQQEKLRTLDSKKPKKNKSFIMSEKNLI